MPLPLWVTAHNFLCQCGHFEISFMRQRIMCFNSVSASPKKQSWRPWQSDMDIMRGENLARPFGDCGGDFQVVERVLRASQDGHDVIVNAAARTAQYLSRIFR